jgi:hypothetical protein
MSPMAQKTHSQEQFKFSLYRYTLKAVELKDVLTNVNDLNSARTLYVLKTLRNRSKFFGTNFLFLSKLKLIPSYSVKDEFTLK